MRRISYVSNLGRSLSLLKSQVFKLYLEDFRCFEMSAIISTEHFHIHIFACGTVSKI